MTGGISCIVLLIKKIKIYIWHKVEAFPEKYTLPEIKKYMLLLKYIYLNI